MTPIASKGRIVMYCPREIEHITLRQSSANKSLMMFCENETIDVFPGPSGEEYPAIVLKVHEEEYLDLFVMMPCGCGMIFDIPDCANHEEPKVGHWRWPPRC